MHASGRLFIMILCAGTLGCQSPAEREAERKREEALSAVGDALMVGIANAIIRASTQPVTQPATQSTGPYSLRLDSFGRPVLIVKGQATTQAYLIDIAERTATPTTMPAD